MNTLLLQTLRKEKTNRPPVWYMRQAGRVLPSYLQLKEQYSFWQMMKNPELGATVTLLPVNELGVDAAILFSDILVIPYAMGMGLDFTDAGPVFEKALAERKNPLQNIQPNPDKLNYIYNVIDQVIKQGNQEVPLIGFCGGPLTVLCYMLEGLSSKNGFPQAMQFIYERKNDVKSLVNIIQELSLIYMEGQIKHGVSAFQLFETHAGLLPFDLYEELFIPMVKKMAQRARELKTPFIYFPKDIGLGLHHITPEVCDFVSIDWQTPLRFAREAVHNKVGLQGNIDPRILYAPETDIVATLKKYVEFGKQHHDWIINLGHGFKPGLPYEKIKFMTDWLKSAQWR